MTRTAKWIKVKWMRHMQWMGWPVWPMVLVWSVILIGTVVLTGTVARQDEPRTVQASNPQAPVPSTPVPVPATTPAPTATGAEPDKTKYQPTPDQAKDLRIDQLEALNIQQVYAAKAQQLPEFQQFQQAVNKLSLECAKIVKENKWPSEVGCDMNANPITFKTNVQVPTQTGPVGPPQPVNGTKPNK